MVHPALSPEPVTAAGVLALVQAIGRHDQSTPAAVDFGDDEMAVFEAEMNAQKGLIKGAQP